MAEHPPSRNERGAERPPAPAGNLESAASRYDIAPDAGRTAEESRSRAQVQQNLHIIGGAGPETPAAHRETAEHAHHDPHHSEGWFKRYTGHARGLLWLFGSWIGSGFKKALASKSEGGGGGGGAKKAPAASHGGGGHH